MQCEIDKGNKNHYCSQECCKEHRRNNIEFNPNYKEINGYTCDYCNKKIRVSKDKQYRNKHHFCSTKCFYLWMSNNLVGENASNYRQALIHKKCIVCDKDFNTYFANQKCCSIECGNRNKQRRKLIKCSNCGRMFERTTSETYWHNKRGHQNIFCSNKCKQEYHVGENHPSYIANRDNLKNQNKSIRWSKKMREWRKLVYERDNYTCQMCGNKSCKDNAVILNAHHIERFSDNELLRFDINNGITLCEDCHKTTYKKEEFFKDMFKYLLLQKH